MKTLTIAALAVLSASTLAQDPTPSPWSIGAYWDMRTKTTSGIVLREIGKIKQPFGLKFDLDVDGFAGSDLDNNMLAGISVGKNFDVAQNVQFKFAIGVATQQNRPSGAGLIAVLTYRF